MDIHIELDQVLLFVSIVIAGSLQCWYWYNKGMKKGWDDSCYALTSVGIIKIDQETLEISRVSDKEFKKIQQEFAEDFE